MIRQISIENFRSIDKATLKLGRLTAIIGRNASGKSNFLSAISLLKELADEGNLDRIVTDKIAPLVSELFFLRNSTNEAKFDFTIDTAQGDQYVFSYSIGYAPIGGNLRLAIPHESLRKVSEKGEIPVYHRERDFAYAGPDNQPIPLKLEPYKLMLAKFSDPDVLAVLSTIREYVFIEAYSDAHDGLKLIAGSSPNMETIDGVAVSLFLKNQGRFESAVNSVQRILPNFVAPTIATMEDVDELSEADVPEDELKNYIVYWKEQAFPRHYSQIALSSGDRRTIHFIFSLFNAEPGALISIEEVENSMHYDRLSKLIDEIRTQAKNRKVQLLFTTHSNEILESLLPKEVAYCKKVPQKGTGLKAVVESEEYAAIKQDLTSEHSAADVVSSGLFD